MIVGAGPPPRQGSREGDGRAARNGKGISPGECPATASQDPPSSWAGKVALSRAGLRGISGREAVAAPRAQQPAATVGDRS